MAGLRLVALVAISLTSAPRNPYSVHEKAYFADAASVEFVRPGLTITVNSAAIAAEWRDHGHLHADRSQWPASGFGRGHHAGLS